MILYIGNKLSMHGNTPSSIEILGNLLSARYNIHRVSSKRNQLARLIDMLWSIVSYRREATLVLIDTYSTLGFYYAFGAAIVCSLLSIPYVPILRGGNLQSRLRNSSRISRFVFGRASRLIAPSNFLFEVFQRCGYSEVQYIPNSIEINRYKMTLRTSLVPRLLWVRSFHSIYNPIMAVKVLEKLLSEFPLAELTMVGPARDQSLRECQDYVTSHGLSAKVKFTGVLTKERWHKLSEEHDIFINTTNIDNTPVSVIEAMALGLPVVSTNVGGVPFLIKDNETGLLVGPNDPDSMAKRIIELIRNPEKALRLTINARRVIEAFSWDVVKDKWFSLLDQFETPLARNE